MLTKNRSELQDALPKLVSGLNDETMLPNFGAVEQKYLVPLIGRELYDDLSTKYNAEGDGTSAKEKELLRLIRHYTGAIGLLGELAANHVQITDFGVRTVQSDSHPKAVGWEYKELKQYLKDTALDGEEILLTYLWANKGDWPLWTASDAFADYKALLIRSGSEFNKYHGLHYPMRTFNLIKTVVDDVQEEYLVAGFGKDLIQYFLDQAEPVEAEEKLLKLLRKGLAFLSVKRACEHYAVKLSDTGFTVVSDFGGDREGEDAGMAAAALQLIERKKKMCERDGKNYVARAKAEAVKLRSEGGSAGFAAAYDAGPLVNYIDPKDRDNGNDRRNLFVM